MAMGMQAEAGAELVLERRLDLAAAAGLHAALLARRGGQLSVDAAAVGHLGTLCLQVLLAAAADWRRSGLAFSICPRSAAFDAALAGFGISADALVGASGQ